MKNQPKFSIITRTRNRLELLRMVTKALKSQEFQDFEWIIVDDNSEHAITKEDINHFQPQFGCKIIRNTQRLGLSKSAIIGIEASNGLYCLLNDDDDYLLPNALRLFNEVVGSSYIGATGGVRKMHGEKKIEETIPKLPPALIDVAANNSITTIATMFSKAAYVEVGGIDSTLEALEDWDLWLRLLLIGDFANIPEVICVQQIGRNDQTKYETHIKEKIKLKNKYLREDIQNNRIGLGILTNSPPLKTFEKIDYLLRLMEKARNIFQFGSRRN